jgi:hypothetical protein
MGKNQWVLKVVSLLWRLQHRTPKTLAFHHPWSEPDRQIGLHVTISQSHGVAIEFATAGVLAHLFGLEHDVSSCVGVNGLNLFEPS